MATQMLFDFMKNVTGNHGTKYMPTTTLGEIQDTMNRLKSDIETFKSSYSAVKEASVVMREELKSVDEIMPLIQKCLGDKYTEEDKNKVTVFVDDYLDTA